MPNQPAADTITVSFTLPKALNDAIEEMARSQFTNKSDIIRRAILAYLPKERAEEIVSSVVAEASKSYQVKKKR